MNDTIHHDGKYKRVSFIVPAEKTCEVRYAVNKCLDKYMVMEVSDVDDAPKGRDWDVIAEWKKSEKASKTNK